MRALFQNGSTLCALLFFAVGASFAVQVNYGRLASEIIPLACIVVAWVAAAAEWVRRPGEKIDWTVTGAKGMVLFGGYVILIRTVGFPAATPLFVMATFASSRPDTKRALAAGAVYGILLAASVYFLFVTCMGNLLPMGWFE